jgi:SAM-dependent methyltransferase
MAGGSWDEAYLRDATPWEIGRPQPAIMRVADAGDLQEPVLDSGCGTGEHALLAASMGYEATGVDVSQSAVERARAKARSRGLLVDFLVGDVLALSDVERLQGPFRSVIDSGCFHTSRTRTGRSTPRASPRSSSRGACSISCASRKTRRARQDRAG